MENTLNVDSNEESTAVTIIQNIFYVENYGTHLLDGVEVIFQHPFNDQILLDTSMNKPPQELLDQALQVGGPNREIGKSSSNIFIVNEETVTYMALPSKTKSQFKDMFVKPRLTVALKSRGSIIPERKLSSATSTSSLKRIQAAKDAEKSRKLSNVSDDLQKTREKCSSSYSTNFCAEQKKNITDAADRLSKSLENESSKIVPIVANVFEADFIITSPCFNSFYESDHETEIWDGARKNQISTSSWNIQEIARRKVAEWMQKSDVNNDTALSSVPTRERF